MKTAQSIQSAAFTDFDNWARHQDDGVLDMDLIQQAAHYANDDAWHNRKSISEGRPSFEMRREMEHRIAERDAQK